MSETIKFKSSVYTVKFAEDLWNDDKTKKIAEKDVEYYLIPQTISDYVAVAKGVSLKEKLSDMDDDMMTVITSLVDLYGSVMMATDLAGAAARDIDAQKFTRNQVINATIRNCGVKYGLTLSKSSTNSRTLSVTSGQIFCEGREYDVSAYTSAVTIPENSTSSAATVIIYLKKTNGIYSLVSTDLNEDLPEDCIELARAVVPANNTASNDAYLSSVAVTDTARREPAWPKVQNVAGQVYVALNRVMPDSEYMVDVEILSATSFHQLGQVCATNKTTNGFLLVTTGTADNVVCKCHVKHPSIA